MRRAFLACFVAGNWGVGRAHELCHAPGSSSCGAHARSLQAIRRTQGKSASTQSAPTAGESTAGRPSPAPTAFRCMPYVLCAAMISWSVLRGLVGRYRGVGWRGPRPRVAGVLFNEVCWLPLPGRRGGTCFIFVESTMLSSICSSRSLMIAAIDHTRVSNEWGSALATLPRTYSRSVSYTHLTLPTKA